MSKHRLDGDEIARLLGVWPDPASDLALELRTFVLEVAPEVAEKIAFNGLCYFKPGKRYGVIGGGVCGIGLRGDCLRLGFIHGAALPDPDGLLRGSGKAARHIEIRTRTDIRRRPFRKLIRAAVAYDPAAE